jgi:hypothetical protein
MAKTESVCADLVPADSYTKPTTHAVIVFPCNKTRLCHPILGRKINHCVTLWGPPQEQLKEKSTISLNTFRVGFNHQALIDLLNTRDTDGMADSTTDLNDAQPAQPGRLQGLVVAEGRDLNTFFSGCIENGRSLRNFYLSAV